MIKQQFNDDWIFYKAQNPDKRLSVCLPHDAMFLEKRVHGCAGGVNSGWYESDDYFYEKTFVLDGGFANKEIFFEFEGVYHDAEIYINGQKAAYRPYGFTNFFVEATKFLDFTGENHIKVFAKNSDQPNCRWYSGAGIYRNVNLYALPERHIKLNGLKITTLDYKARKIKIEAETNCEGTLTLEILGEGELIHTCQIQSSGLAAAQLSLPELKLWDTDSPVLYTCRATFFDDVYEVRFGVRGISCDTANGFCLNGKRVILKGACIHADNGLLGAASYKAAEKRKARILKENGFNAVRAAHNPASKDFLDACDELGLLVMDEYTDMWFMHKTKFDYASSIMEWWKKDLKDLVDKDYNHPSVIMYSVGNEVGESARKEGVEFCGKMVDFLHKLDNRPVTCGINIFFNFLSSLGMGVYSDKKAEKNKQVGSAFFNYLAGIFGDDFMKFGATLRGSDRKTKDVFSVLDVAGYNYGILRYKKDVKKYPDRVIVGSETFCRDAAKFYDFAKVNPAVIGDFVWAGMDYLGEVGIGAWESLDYAADFKHVAGWISAGSGRIDLTGKRLGEMSYMRVAYGIDDIGLAVKPVSKVKKRYSPSAWKMTNAQESWSWNGCEGAKAEVEAYSRDYRTELFINGKPAGKKRMNKSGRVKFKVRYQSGTLTLRSYDKDGNLKAEKSLVSAGKETVLNVFAENNSVSLDEGLCYVRLQFTDKSNIVKPLERAEVRLEVSGGKLLALGNACPYNSRGYMTDTTDTYYGEALAIIKPQRKGNIEIKAYSKLGNGVLSVEVL